jgi:exopolysaccharide biosynthesis protein
MQSIFYTFLCITVSLLGDALHYFEDRAYESIVHVLEVDLSACSFELIKCDGVETPSSIAKRYGGDAAINGGFFHGNARLGMPSGIFQLHSIRYTPTDRKRGAIGWKKDLSDILIDRLDSSPDGSLYPLFHPEHKARWEAMETILGSTPVLIMDGTLIKHFEEESVRPSFVTGRHARSAIGWIDPTHLICVVVIKSSTENSLGMTLPQLANYLHARGAKCAINLDGGSSSTLYYKGKIFCSLGEIDEDSNLESVYGERKVGNVILITRLEKETKK